MSKKSKKPFNRILSGWGLLLSLCNVSLIGVGFSNWIYGTITSASADINASVGEVKNGNFFTMGSVNMFSLGPDGLVEDYAIVSSSTIEAIFYIDNALAYEFSNGGTLNFKAELSCSDSSFLSTYIGTNPSVSNSTSVNTSFSGNTLSSDVTYTVTSTGTSTVTITYQVTDDGTMNTYYSNKPTFAFAVRSK
ncbi:MAG: hypothetical protein MR775_03425 [Erysipelotrichaceae bacterium]|nr:hypothetical protein [Erysipelotrichaceae bacterium]